MPAELREKRYEEVAFTPPASWSKTTNADGSRTYTNSGGIANVKITKPSGATQEHLNIPAGKATVVCGGGDVQLTVAP